MTAPAGWRWVQLTEVARLETGHTPSRRKPGYWDGDIPWIGIKDARRHHGREIEQTNQNCTMLGVENSAARLLPPGTVCLSRTASIGYITRLARTMVTSQDFVNWVCGDKLDSRFLMYLLLAEVGSLSRFAHGSTHQTIYFPEVKAFHVCLPPLPEQLRIAAILGALDDKIELNRRMNRTLEEMAQALFKSWFIDFDGHDQDTLVDSELGPIPEGWSVRPVYSVADYINGAAFRKFLNRGEPHKTMPVIKIREIKDGISDGTVFVDVALPDKYRIHNGDILFCWSGSPDTSIGTYVWTQGEAWLNQHIFKVVPHSGTERYFVYYLLCHLNPVFVEIARDKQTTGLGHVTARALKRLMVAVPPVDELERFNAVIGPLYERVQVAAFESATLAELRDTLLPKLISGELRVPESLDELLDLHSDAEGSG